MNLANDGSTAPALHGDTNLPFLCWQGFFARLNTRVGKQLLRPTYGLDYSAHLGRPFDAQVASDIESEVRRALIGIEDCEVISSQVRVAPGSGRGTADIEIFVEV